MVWDVRQRASAMECRRETGGFGAAFRGAAALAAGVFSIVTCSTIFYFSRVLLFLHLRLRAERQQRRKTACLRSLALPCAAWHGCAGGRSLPRFASPWWHFWYARASLAVGTAGAGRGPANAPRTGAPAPTSLPRASLRRTLPGAAAPIPPTCLVSGCCLPLTATGASARWRMGFFGHASAANGWENRVPSAGISCGLSCAWRGCYRHVAVAVRAIRGALTCPLLVAPPAATLARLRVLSPEHLCLLYRAVISYHLYSPKRAPSSARYCALLPTTPLKRPSLRAGVACFLPCA